jgi:predicted MFS family arabinose efflux permease
MLASSSDWISMTPVPEKHPDDDVVGEPRLTTAYRALRDIIVRPSLRRALLAYALACAGDAAFTVTIGVVAFREGGAAAVGLVALLRMLPSALGSAFLTAYADRIRRERVLLASTLAWAAAVAATAFAFAAGLPAGAVYALAVLATLAMTVFRPVQSALLPLLCSETTVLTSANVVRGVVEAGATIAGPALAGLALALGNPTTAFVVIAALGLVAAVPLTGIQSEVPRPGATPGAHAIMTEALDGVKVVTRHRDLRLLFGLGFAQTVVRGALNVFIVVLALHQLDTGDAGVATLAAAIGVGGLVGSVAASFLVGNRHLGRWLAVALALWGTPIAVMGLAPRAAVALVMLAAVGLANALIDVPMFTLPVRLAEDAVLARAFGVFESVIALGVALGSVVSPVLIDRAGLRPAMAVVGLSLPLLAAVRWRALHRLDARLSVRDDEIRVLRRVPMLALLPVALIEHLATRVRRRAVPAGTDVVVQGEAGASVFVIVDGRAAVLGDGQSLAELGPGEPFGEIAVLKNVPRTATVCARTDLELFELDRDDFLAALGRHRASTEAAEDLVARHLARNRLLGAGL